MMFSEVMLVFVAPLMTMPLALALTIVLLKIEVPSLSTENVDFARAGRARFLRDCTLALQKDWCSDIPFETAPSCVEPRNPVALITLPLMVPLLIAPKSTALLPLVVMRLSDTDRSKLQLATTPSPPPSIAVPSEVVLMLFESMLTDCESSSTSMAVPEAGAAIVLSKMEVP